MVNLLFSSRVRDSEITLALELTAVANVACDFYVLELSPKVEKFKNQFLKQR